MNAGGADHVFHRATGRPRAMRAVGTVIITDDDSEYLDGAGGAIASTVGHGHPEVIEAIAQQAAQLEHVHPTQFTNAAVDRFAARLAPHLPLTDARIFPVSGGSEANETAIKLARSIQLARGESGRHVVIARSGAYHGNSRAALDASDRASLRAGYEPWLGQTLRVSAANPYRDQRSGADYAAELDAAITAAGPSSVAAFLAEPIAGATLGAVSPPDDYWPAIAEVCRRHGVLLIADEVMTGFGRTGTWFGIDHWQVRPDILTAGKGASGGYWPLGLCITSGAHHDTVIDAGKWSHGFTWSHHPIGAAVADTILAIIERDHLVEASATMGASARQRLADALGGHPSVGQIRGRGLLLAIELVSDRDSKAPFDRSRRIAEQVTAAAFGRRLTVYPCSSAVDGNVGDAVMLGPALNVAQDILDEMVDRLIAAVLDVLPDPAL